MSQKFTAQQIAHISQGTIIGDESATISNFAKIEEAQAGDLSFLGNDKYISYIHDTKASIIIINNSLFKEEYKTIPTTFILVDNAYITMNNLLEFYQKSQTKNSNTGIIHPSAVIDSNSIIDTSATIDALSIIGSGATIGKESHIYAQVYIGKNVIIGDNCIIYPGVRIMDNCVVGNGVIIHGNAVIGADGFGYVPNGEGGYKKTPQLGNVVIEDNVEIGANTTIDRASLGSTTIQKGVKIDNLVQVAHNVTIGEDTAIAAQAGISGSTKIGSQSIIGGQAGIVGHITLAPGTKVNAQSGVTKAVKINNTALTGSPAGPYHETLRIQLLTRKLPELFKQIEAVQKAIGKNE